MEENDEEKKQPHEVSLGTGAVGSIVALTDTVVFRNNKGYRTKSIGSASVELALGSRHNGVFTATV